MKQKLSDKSNAQPTEAVVEVKPTTSLLSRLGTKRRKSRKSDSVRIHLYAFPGTHEAFDWIADWYGVSKKELMDKIISGAICEAFDGPELSEESPMNSPAKHWYVRKTYVISREALESDARLQKPGKRDNLFTHVVSTIYMEALENKSNLIKAYAKARPILESMSKQVEQSLKEIRSTIEDNGDDFSEYLNEIEESMSRALARFDNDEDELEYSGAHGGPWHEIPTNKSLAERHKLLMEQIKLEIDKGKQK